MPISINMQRITRASARRISAAFSTVDLHDNKDEWPEGHHEISLFIEGPGHEDAAARIAALINEQVVRRDNRSAVEIDMEMHQAIAEADDGPTYDGPPEDDEEIVDDGGGEAKDQETRFIEQMDAGFQYEGPNKEEASRLDAEEGVSLGAAREAVEEERAYNEEDRLGREAHLRSVRRDDKPWTPHEDQIEEDVRAGRRDADGEPI